MKKFLKFSVLVSSFLLLANPVLAASSVFRAYTLDLAKTTAKQEGKLLLIDFTASWCGPCHRMDKESWSNPAVQKWVAENAVAIQLDVDKEKSISESFKIMAMPSVVAFSQSDQSSEFDRHVGYLNSTELLNWLNAIKNGQTWLDMLGHDVERLSGKGEEELQARRKYSRALLDKGDFAKAGPQYVWLWKNLPKDPAVKAGRLMSLAGEIVLLIRRDAATKEKFLQIRDESENSDLIDFIILNEILDDTGRSLSWFDKAKILPEKQEEIRKVNFLLEKLLLRNDRYADICILYPDPVAELKERRQSAEKFMEIMEKQHGKAPPDPLPKDIAVLYASLLAAKKESEARKFAAECLKVRNTNEMKQQLVQAALAAKQARSEQRKWASGNAELLAKLNELLKQGKSKK